MPPPPSPPPATKHHDTVFLSLPAHISWVLFSVVLWPPFAAPAPHSFPIANVLATANGATHVLAACRGGVFL